MSLRKRCYFTLIELMIVLTIILAMGTVLSFNIVHAIKQQRFLSASQEILSRLQMAQDLMSMHQTNVDVTITCHSSPKPHVTCTLSTGIHTQTRRDALQKLLEQTQNISSIGDISFTDASGTEHRGTILLTFHSAGNYNPEGVLRIYAEPNHNGAQQTIVIAKHPSPLSLIVGEPAKQDNRQNVAGQNIAAFPDEIYEIIKRK